MSSDGTGAKDTHEVSKASILNRCGSRDMCITGLLIMPSLLFNPNTFGRVAQFLLFWFFAALLGKKNSIVMTLFVITGIVLFNLLVPYGRALASFGAFKITEGALLAGIHRAVTMEGLIILSKASIQKDLRFPGAFGGLLGESLRMFAALTDRKRRISPKTLIADIDAVLFDISGTLQGVAAPADVCEARPGAVKKTTAAGIIMLAAAVLASWGIFAVGIIL
jgi:heptaprenyl diphosphate synthase